MFKSGTASPESLQKEQRENEVNEMNEFDMMLRRISLQFPSFNISHFKSAYIQMYFWGWM